MKHMNPSPSHNFISIDFTFGVGGNGGWEVGMGNYFAKQPTLNVLH